MKKNVNFDDFDGKSNSNEIKSKIDFAKQHRPLIFVGFYTMLCGIVVNVYLLIKLISILF